MLSMTRRCIIMNRRCSTRERMQTEKKELVQTLVYVQSPNRLDLCEFTYD